jgi:hypothetical protein
VNCLNRKASKSNDGCIMYVPVSYCRLLDFWNEFAPVPIDIPVTFRTVDWASRRGAVSACSLLSVVEFFLWQIFDILKIQYRAFNNKMTQKDSISGMAFLI